MKTVTILSLLLLTSPAFGELTKEDLRTILKEEVRPIIKEEITASEKRTREHIDLKIETVNARIDGLEKSLNARIDSTNAKIDAVEKNLNARIDDVNEKFNRVWFVIIGLMGLVTAAIAVPQIIIAYRERGQKDMERRWDALQAELQELREQIKTTPPTPPVQDDPMN